MGIISDAIDALEDWCKDLFKDGIQSQFDGISDLLSDTFSQTTGTGGSGGLVNDFYWRNYDLDNDRNALQQCRSAYRRFHSDSYPAE